MRTLDLAHLTHHPATYTHAMRGYDVNFPLLTLRRVEKEEKKKNSVREIDILPNIHNATKHIFKEY